MTKQIEIKPVRTYATAANAIKAIEKAGFADDPKLRFFMMNADDGRFFPVFVGESATARGVHFHFNVIG